MENGFLSLSLCESWWDAYCNTTTTKVKVFVQGDETTEVKVDQKMFPGSKVNSDIKNDSLFPGVSRCFRDICSTFLKQYQVSYALFLKNDPFLINRTPSFIISPDSAWRFGLVSALKRLSFQERSRSLLGREEPSPSSNSGFLWQCF